MPRGDRGGAKGRKRQTLKHEPPDVQARTEVRRTADQAARWAAPRSVFIPGAKTVYGQRTPAKAVPVYGEHAAGAVAKRRPPALTVREKRAAQAKLDQQTRAAYGRPVRMGGRQQPNIIDVGPTAAEVAYGFSHAAMAQRARERAAQRERAQKDSALTHGVKQAGLGVVPGATLIAGAIDAAGGPDLLEHIGRTARNTPGSAARALQGFGPAALAAPFVAAYKDLEIHELMQPGRKPGLTYDYRRAWKALQEVNERFGSGAPSGLELLTADDPRQAWRNEQARMQEHSAIYRDVAKPLADYVAYMASDGPVVIGYTRDGAEIYRSKSGGKTQDRSKARTGRVAKFEEDPVPVILTVFGSAYGGAGVAFRVGAALERTKIIRGNRFQRGLEPGMFEYRAHKGGEILDPQGRVIANAERGQVLRHPETGQVLSAVPTARNPLRRAVQEHVRRPLVRAGGELLGRVGVEATTEHARAVRIAKKTLRRSEQGQVHAVTAPFYRAMRKLKGPERVAVWARDVGVPPSEYKAFVTARRAEAEQKIARLEQQLENPDISEKFASALRERVRTLNGEVRDHNVMLRILRDVDDELVSRVDTDPRMSAALAAARRVAETGGDVLEQLGKLDPEARRLRKLLPQRIVGGARWVEESSAVYNRRMLERSKLEALQEAYDEANAAAGAPVRTSERSLLEGRMAQLEALRADIVREVEVEVPHEQAAAELARLDKRYKQTIEGLIKALSPYEGRMRAPHSGREMSIRQWEQNQRNRLGGKGGRRGKRKSVRQEELEIAEQALQQAADRDPALAEFLRRRDELTERLTPLPGEQPGVVTRLETVTEPGAFPSKSAAREHAALEARLPEASTEPGTGLNTWENQAARDLAVNLAPRLEAAKAQVARTEAAYVRKYGRPPTDEKLGELIGGPEVEALLAANPDVGYASFARRVSMTAYQRSGARRLTEPSVTRLARGVALRTSQHLPDPSASHLSAFIASIGYKHALERGRLAFSIGERIGDDGTLKPNYYAVIDQDVTGPEARAPGTRETQRAQREADAHALVNENDPAGGLQGYIDSMASNNAAIVEGWVEDYGPRSVRQISKADYNRLFGEFKPGGRSAEFIRRFWDKPTAVWRALTLTYRPAWIVNNVVGNTMLFAVNHAFTGGVRAYARAVVDEAADRDDLMPHALERTGYTEAELAGTTSSAIDRTMSIQDKAGAKQAWATTHWAVRRINEWILNVNAVLSDNVPRRASWYRVVANNRDWINRQLETNYTWEELNRELVAVSKDPTRGDARLHAIHDRLIEQVMRQQVDFTNMSDFERGYIRRVVPFYSWLRGMSVAMWHFTFEHPLKAAAMMVLGQAANAQLAQEYGRGAEMFRGSLGLGRKGDVAVFLGTLGLNPFATPAAVLGMIGNVTGGVIGEGHSPVDNPLLQFHPVFQAAITAATQRDIFSGKRLESPGAGPLGIYGQEALLSFPQAQLAKDVVLPPFFPSLRVTAEGTTGEARLTPPGGHVGGVSYKVLNYLGIPIRQKNVVAARNIVVKQLPEVERKAIAYADELREVQAGQRKLGIKTKGLPTAMPAWMLGGPEGVTYNIERGAELDHRYQLAEAIELRRNPAVAAITHKHTDKRTPAEKIELERFRNITLYKAIVRTYGLGHLAANAEAIVNAVPTAEGLQKQRRGLLEKSGISAWHTYRGKLRKAVEDK